MTEIHTEKCSTIAPNKMCINNLESDILSLIAIFGARGEILYFNASRLYIKVYMDAEANSFFSLDR